MRNRSQKGFTLIELLIVIAIIGILAAVLIPNLLNARARAFDTAAQTCLKEIATAEEIEASVDPWEYSGGDFAGAAADPHGNGINSCANVLVAEDHPAAPAGAPAGFTPGENNFGYTAVHNNGTNTYRIESGAGVTVDNP